MNKLSENKISTDEESQNELDCTCQILNDTSLSEVGDSDCSCSQCLEANLNAFNELKQLQEEQMLIEARSLGRIPNKNTNISKLSLNKQDGMNNQVKFGRNSNSSINKKTISKNHPSNNQIGKRIEQKIDDSTRLNRFTRQNINDYILITKQRTRQYLNQRNKADNQNQKLKNQLKQKIKENLQILKYAAKNIQQKDQLLKESQLQSKTPAYNWNHTPIVFRQIEFIRQSKAQCKNKLLERKNQRSKINTNLQKLIPDFSQNPSQFLQSAKQKRLQKFKQCKGCPYDQCPNHHMRTSKQRLLEINQFIKQEVKKYIQKKKQQKQTKEEKQKIKQAKLRAIEIRSKYALRKSKKYDPSESRSSFHLSMDHFSTFSDLRVHKKQKDEERQNRKEVNKMMKQKGSKFQQAIYEEVFQNQPPLESNVQPIRKTQLPKQMNKEYCEKITKQAKVHSPKRLKSEDQEHKKEKKQKRKNPMNLNQEKKKTKQLALQIQRKKLQLMQEYQKQKQSKESKNKKIKNQLQQTLLKSKN